MPKRKRSLIEPKEDELTRELELRKINLEKKLVHGRKLLNKALKTARGFERQKLGKRIKLAAEKNDEVESERMQRELDILKKLDVGNAAEAHLHKIVLKSKSISELKLLPDPINKEAKKSDPSPEEKLAVANVTARMFNTKPVKEAISIIMSSIYTVLGISDPVVATRNSSTVVEDTAQKSHVGEISVEPNKKRSSEDLGDVSEHGGVHSDGGVTGGEDETGQERARKIFESKFGPDLESESDEFLRYDGLVGGSSDEDMAEDLDPTKISRPLPKSKALKRFGSPSISISQSSRSSSPPPRPKKSSKQSQPTSIKPNSTFLPTLMGGYWSGSESATDDEEVAAAPRKNRRGQQARRAIWEKKYGVKAKHLQGQAAAKKPVKEWDPVRGARGTDDKRPRRGRGGSRGGGAVVGRNTARSTGENAIPIKPRVRDIGKKDDSGPLHPSWEAAKRAKEAKKSVAFEGKKVVFD